MTIEQKAREIAEKTYHSALRLGPNARIEAARLGIIEGRRQAFEEAAKVAEASVTPIEDMCCKAMARNIATAIRALIEEQKL